MKNIAQKEERKQPKIKTEMNGKGLTVHAGLLPVLTFMEKLLFRKRVQEAVRKERGANARYQIVDAMQMIVIGLIAGATSMVQIVKVWADEVLMKIAGWKEIPVDTTIGRIMKRRARVIFRGDRGFFSGELLDYLESVSAGYLIKVKWKNRIWLLEGQKGEAVEGKAGWEQADFMYQCATWNRARQFVAVRKLIKIERGLLNIPVYEYFCYVTTERLSPIEAHRSYGKRATCETWIEECKSQMNAGHLRTSEFLANAALFQCAVLAYNLLKWMALLTGGTVQQWEVKTMRLWLIRVAGKLTKGSRQLTLKLPEKFLHQEEWRVWEGMSLSVAFG